MLVKIRKGATWLDPFPVGIRADGETAYHTVARKEGGVHCLISGATGSGKTYGEKPVLLTSAALQCDQIVVDVVKGVQSYASIAGALQMYEVDKGRAIKLLRVLMDRVLPARTNFLATEGLTEWAPRSRLRPLRIHIEEAWRFADKDTMVGLAVALRSAAGQLTVSLQQPTWDQMPTVLRNQMGAFRCYGLMDSDYNQYSLPEDVVAAGANPAQWGNEDPGMQYLITPGSPMREKTMPVRSFSDGSGENTFAAAAAYVTARLGPMDPVTAGALGELWDTHIPPLELVRKMGVITPGPATTEALDEFTPPVSVPVGPVPDPDQEDDGDDDQDVLDALADLEDPEFCGEEITVEETDDGLILITGEDGEEFEIDIDDDTGMVPENEPVHPVVARMIGDPPKDGISPEEFQELIGILVTEFLQDPTRERLERRDFVNHAADAGWSIATFYKYLNLDARIVKDGRGWVRVAGTEDAA